MAASISFIKQPASLANFFPSTSRENQQRIITRITFTSSGEVILAKRRFDQESSTSIYNFNLNESHGHWKYIIGSENLSTFLAFKKNLNNLVAGISMYGNLNFSWSDDKNSLTIDESSWSGGTSSGRGKALFDLFSAVNSSRPTIPTVYSTGSTIEGDYLSNDPSGFYGAQYFYVDYLIGTEYADAIMGYRGNDTLDGNQGEDELYGGYGNDKLYGRDGNDYLYGEQGNDPLEGGNGDDYLDGGLGVDTMIGGAGNDTYLIDRITDVITDSGASTDIDTVLIPVFLTYTLPANIEGGELTGNHNSNLTGNALNNDLDGNGGNNFLNGGAGADEITGGLGNDTLIGGIENDDLVGGAGKDLFRFTSSVITGTSGQGTDEIIDFQGGIDKIQIQKSGFKVGSTAISNVVISNSTNNTFGTGANFHFNTATSDLFFKGQTIAIADVLGITSLSVRDFSLI